MIKHEELLILENYIEKQYTSHNLINPKETCSWSDTRENRQCDKS